MAAQVTIRDLMVRNAIYIIRGRIGKAESQVLYVGKAGRQSVTDRLRMHIECGRRDRTSSIAKLIREEGDSFLDWSVEVLHADDWRRHGETLDSAEKALIQLHCPRCNRQHMVKTLTGRD